MRYHGSPDGDLRWRGPWPQSGHHRPGRRFRFFFPVVFSLLVQLPSAFFSVQDRHPVPLHLAGAQFGVALALAIIGPLALLGGRRFPAAVVVIVTAAACLDLFAVPPDNSPPYISLAFAIVFAVNRGARVWAWASVATAWVVSITAAIILQAVWSPVRIALTTFAILIVFGISEAMRTRADRYAQLVRFRAERQQSEVQAERVRIARELHDVLAHSLSQINVQAGVGLHLMDSQPEQARSALASIKETSKTALDEVRSVLGVLRAGGGMDPDAPLVPEPDLSRIAGLAASVTAQGVEVTVSNVPSEVPEATQLAIYRIVQESLTNVLRHAQATRAWVELGQDGGYYTISVRDNGVARTDPDGTEGRGILGMRERAELLGGTMQAAPLPEGGFRVSARIPVRERASTQ